MKCTQCGKIIPNDSRFCKYCGVQLSRTCAACGAAVDEDAHFCSACGAEIIAAHDFDLDISKNVPDIAPGDAALTASGVRNVAGFYFSHRVSRKNRHAPAHFFDVSDRTLAYVEGNQLYRLDLEDELQRHRSEVSLDTNIEAVAIRGDDILTAGFDWGDGGDWKVMLWTYDDALNIRTQTEVTSVVVDEEQQSWRMRLTDKCLFIFSWDNYDKGRRTVIKYNLETKKLEKKTISGRKTYIWYVDGEKIYFRGERMAQAIDENGKPVVENYFGVIDTAPDKWTAHCIRTFGDGPDEIPDGAVYCDFEKGIVWTRATLNERNANGYDQDAYVARDLKPGCPIRQDLPVWKLPSKDHRVLFFDYFDGAYAIKARNAFAIDTFDQAGVMHHWKYSIYGDTENVIVWGDKILADMTSLGYRVYPFALDGPEDIYKDGTALLRFVGA